MDSLTLLEKSYKKSRFNVGGEWHDKFRWCFGGDGGGGGGGDAAGFDASAMAANAAAANAQAAAEQQGFAEFGGAQTAEQAAAEQEGLTSAAQDAFDMGRINETGLNQLGLELNVEDPTFATVQPRGPTATFADVRNTVADLLDPTPTGLLISALAPGVAPVTKAALSLGANALARETGAAQAIQGATGINPAAGIIGQAAQQAGVVGPAPSPAPSASRGFSLEGTLDSIFGPTSMTQAEIDATNRGYAEDQAPDVPNYNKGGVVSLQSGIGSLYGRR